MKERNTQFSTNFLFNAKELDDETGLYYYGARYLNPTGAMWLSVDPMWEKYAGMSPYNYCMGNPVKMVDPDGEDWILAMGSVVIWYGGEYLDISVEKHRYKATSGQKDIAHYDAYNNFELENHQFAKYQYEKNSGPTVKGHYYLSLENEPGKKAILSNGEIKPSDGKGIENLQNLVDKKTGEVVAENASWGHYRIKMNPVPGKVKQPISPYTGEPLEGSDQRGLNTFYFHDSHKGHSSGCHEIESRFFDDLIEYQQQGNKRIEVLVGYPNDNWSTNGCTEY